MTSPRLRIHGPQTMTGLLGAAAAGGVLLFVVLMGIAAWSRREAPGAGRVDVRGLGLRFPVPAVTTDAMSDSFEDRRGPNAHHAVDILAPRHSPVVAVDDGTVARLGRSPAGGISVYQLDRSERYCYYYAHLEAYATGLTEGQGVKQGQVLGYVGTTGNTPRTTPHLHFAIFLVTAPKQCWGGRPIDPYPIWQ